MKMGPNKIEKQCREKLNSREIQPSVQAWDRLDAMLSVGEEKKTKRSFGWLYIAASVLILVSLGLFLFNPKNTEMQPVNDVVGTEIKNNSVQTERESIPAQIIQNEKQQESIASSEKQQSTINNQGVSIIRNNQKTTDNQSADLNQNQINRDKTIEFQNSSDVALKELPKIIEPKEIVISKKQINAQSDESLLADLDNAAKQSAGKNQNVKISAKSLLSQVDGEVEYTFREKTFNKLNKNYQEIKVALANRNIQE
jgi:hypothetical protein